MRLRLEPGFGRRGSLNIYESRSTGERDQKDHVEFDLGTGIPATCPAQKERYVIIRIEVSDAELEEMNCSSAEEFEEQIRDQLDNGVVTSDGGAGSDWMAEYELEVVKVR